MNLSPDLLTYCPELFPALTGNILRRHADYLHASTTSDVHRVDHVGVFHLWVALDKDDLLRAIDVDLRETGPKPALVDLLGVDREHTTGKHLEHNLVALRVCRLHSRRRIRKLDVDRLSHRRQCRHEDDEQHEQHVDHGRDVDLVAQTRPASG